MLKKSLSILCCVTALSASTTMCFKKNHVDPSTIEIIALDGGKCNGSLSIKQMQNTGYIIDNIKMESSDKGFDYIYILKKNEPQSSENLTLEELTKKMAGQKRTESVKMALVQGEELYKKDCIKCHGVSGEKRAYNSSRPLNTLSRDEFINAIRNYSLENKTGMFANIMKPYADLLTTSRSENIINYLKSVNNIKTYEK